MIKKIICLILLFCISCTNTSNKRNIDNETNFKISTDKKNKKYEYDFIVLASHTDQSSKIIKNIDKNVSILLNKFRYQNNLAYLHFDQSIMPKNKLISFHKLILINI